MYCALFDTVNIGMSSREHSRYFNLSKLAEIIPCHQMT